jgi:ADP-ribose pyrophosphatase
MDKKKLEELENLFNTYGVKSKELVKLDKTFLKIESYKVELNLNKTIYRDKLVKNGGTGSACIVVPIFDNDDVLMVVQPRVFSLRGVLLDFPSGYIEKEEDEEKAALRELQEETGYTSSSIHKIASYYQDEGASEAIINVFVATNIKKVSELSLDKDEYLAPFITSFTSLDELIEKGYIKSGGSQLAIAKVKLMRGQK